MAQSPCTTLSPTSFQFHGQRSATLNYNPSVSGYGFNVDLQVGGIAGGMRLLSDGGHSASIVAITDLQGNDLSGRVSFESGLQFPSATAATPEPTSLVLWSLGALGFAAMRRRSRIARPSSQRSIQ